MPAHTLPASLHPVVARVLAARDVLGAAELDLSLSGLLSPSTLRGIDAAVALVIDAVDRRARIVVAGDYDCDGATGVAVAVRGLRALGAAQVDYVVPNRLTMGYGLSVELAEAAAAVTGAMGLLITVDNGIASLAGVARARELGLRVLVTDHHLPGPELPAADALLDPSQPDCAFASKALAGVGVMFYLLVAVRAALRARGAYRDRPEPDLGALLDLVALGTVADLVPLDRNNRILVAAGLQRIRAGRAHPGVLALLEVAGRRHREISTSDLGFALGPRINAAGRLDDIRIGIRCLLCDDPHEALQLARELDGINRQRRELQAQMSGQAQGQLEQGAGIGAFGVALFDEQWHEGVVGLIAARLRESANRPAIAFAPAQQAGLLKGSARSVPGLHIRDVIAAVDAQAPGLILRFGGHAMAAGLSLAQADLDEFRGRFDAACRSRLSPAQLERVLETDGPLTAAELTLDTVLALERAGPWGQAMPEPVFEGEFEVQGARTVGADALHVRYQLAPDGGPPLVAVDFNGAERMRGGGRVSLAYQLAINRWQGRESLELRILDLRGCAPD
ncbi:single-stranded-DNA-specific exonuclease RecJ [Panacagrimonas sp.]|uniref:single-stranded-DNA-specific exonuclease RecJ n=1 Tax=Panacagrimonas sp. TaxID=2480088 RepID=UPI003B521F4B